MASPVISTPPDTLPGDFAQWDGAQQPQQGAAPSAPPDTLPADFDGFDKPATPATPPQTPTSPLIRLAEDVLYPMAGASAGAAAATAATAGAVTGPGDIPIALGGAALGGLAGSELKRGIRAVTGRDDENSTGLTHIKDDLLDAVGGAVQEYPMITKLLGNKAVQGIVARTMAGKGSQLSQDASDIGARLAPSKQAGSDILGKMESWARNSLGGGATMAKGMDRQISNSVQQAGEAIADHFSSIKDPAEAGQAIQDAIGASRQLRSKTYQEAMDKIESAGADQITVPFSANLTSAAQDAIKALSTNSDISDAALHGTDKGSALKFLQQFETPYTSKPTGIMDASGQPVVRQVPKQASFQDIRKTITSIDSALGSGEVTAGKAQLMKFRQALVDQSQSMLQKADPKLANMFQNANEEYQATSDLLEKSITKRIVNSENPEKIADYVLSGTQSHADNLRTLIGPEQMKAVQGAALRRMVTNSVDKSGEVDGVKFAQQWRQMGPEAQKALYPDEAHRAAIDKLANVWQNTAKPLTEAQTTGVGRFQGNKMGTEFGTLGVGGVMALMGHPAGLAAAMTTAAGLHFAPAGIAKLLSSPRGAQIAADLFTHGPTTAGYAKVASKALYALEDLDENGNKQ